MTTATKVALAALALLPLAGAGLVAAGGTGSDLRRHTVEALVALAAAALAALAARPFLPSLLGSRGVPPAVEPERAGKGTALVLAVALAHHALAFLVEGPLVQVDSFSYLHQVPFLRPEPTPPHTPPLYALFLSTVRLLLLAPSLATWLSAVVFLQHALAVLVALAVERLVRRETGSALAAALAGLVVALDGQLAIYAQSIMTEALGVPLAVLAVALLVEARGRERADAWLAGAGAAAALATLARQASTGLFLLLVLHVLLAWPGTRRERARAAALVALAALLPLALVLAHNHALCGRASLTAATGRDLIVRATWEGMPDLTEPGASPDDPQEKARRLAWAERKKNWREPYEAVRRGLGWSDAEIDAAFVRFYLEQVRRHPGAFVATTIDYAWEILRSKEGWERAVEQHEVPRRNGARVLRAGPPGEDVGPAREPPWVLRALADAALPTRFPVLALALAAPFLARGARGARGAGGRARGVVLLALAAVLYYVLIASVANVPIARYRLPCLPFLAVAVGVAVGARSSFLQARQTLEP